MTRTPRSTEPIISSFVADPALKNMCMGIGPKVRAFERQFAERLHLKDFAMLDSGSNSLHMAVRLLDLPPGSEVILPSFTWISCAHAVVLAGHAPVFCDVDINTYNVTAATIEPQLSVDARIQQVTADRSFSALPKALQHISLYEPSGPLVDANRGLLEYSDLLKRPVESFKYLLDTVETATVSMDSFVLHLDMVFLASSNETYLDAFKEHPDFREIGEGVLAAWEKGREHSLAPS